MDFPKKIVIYTNRDGHCKICARVMPYVRWLAQRGKLFIRDGNRLDRIWLLRLREDVRVDFAWQNDALPLVYVDGAYVDFEDLESRVKAFEIAQNDGADICRENFWF